MFVVLVVEIFYFIFFSFIFFLISQSIAYISIGDKWPTTAKAKRQHLRRPWRGMQKFYMQFVSSYSICFQEGMKREVKEGKSHVGLSGLHHVDDMV